jgi:hypothetical protein
MIVGDWGRQVFKLRVNISEFVVGRMIELSYACCVFEECQKSFAYKSKYYFA